MWGQAKERVKGETDPDEKVYFVEAAGLDRIKIGVTTNIENRLRKLQCGSPVPLNVVALIPGGEALEKRIHTMLVDCRVQGEWFRAEAVKTWLTALFTDSTVK